MYFAYASRSLHEAESRVGGGCLADGQDRRRIEVHQLPARHAAGHPSLLRRRVGMGDNVHLGVTTRSHDVQWTADRNAASPVIRAALYALIADPGTLLARQREAQDSSRLPAGDHERCGDAERSLPSPGDIESCDLATVRSRLSTRYARDGAHRANLGARSSRQAAAARTKGPFPSRCCGARVPRSGGRRVLSLGPHHLLLVKLERREDRPPAMHRRHRV